MGMANCLVDAYRRHAVALASLAGQDQGVGFVQKRQAESRLLLTEAAFCLSRLAVAREAVAPLERADGVEVVLKTMRSAARTMPSEHAEHALAFLRRVTRQSTMRSLELSEVRCRCWRGCFPRCRAPSHSISLTRPLTHLLYPSS